MHDGRPDSGVTFPYFCNIDHQISHEAAIIGTDPAIRNFQNDINNMLQRAPGHVINNFIGGIFVTRAEDNADIAAARLTAPPCISDFRILLHTLCNLMWKELSYLDTGDAPWPKIRYWRVCHRFNENLREMYDDAIRDPPIQDGEPILKRYLANEEDPKFKNKTKKTTKGAELRDKSSRHAGRPVDLYSQYTAHPSSTRTYVAQSSEAKTRESSR